MPSKFVQDHPDFAGHLIYEAPVDEKTKKLREKFDVDEETGYPRHYSWRRMASLGKEFRPEDAYEKLGYHNPDEYISTKVAITGANAFFSVAAHITFAYLKGRSLWTRIYQVPIFMALSTSLSFWVLEKSLERNGMRHAIAIDYLKKHPERFETVYRPKFREILFMYLPIR